jgi:6-phosphogluconate dehydrogenase
MAANDNSTPNPGKDTADVGLIGLAVMGQNLALNMADHGFSVAVYNRTTSVTDAFIADNRPKQPSPGVGVLLPASTEADLVRAIRPPRRMVLMVKAGGPVDAVIKGLLPLLERGDVIVDGGNSHWEDTIRREKQLRERGILFVGSGVSGGEEGARFGPSLMPGGDPGAYRLIEPIWTAISAKVDRATGKPLLGAAPGRPISAPGADPCCAYIGPDGAGHYVKMVHNGIEYGDMQMIGEAYDLLRRVAGLSAPEMSEVFRRWNAGPLDSFLIEITADVLAQKDPATGEPLVDVILDAAGQKGTGKWTSTSALDLAVPAATIAEAVFARCISAIKDERARASRVLKGPEPRPLSGEERRAFIDAVADALYCSKICSYAQGFQLMGAAGRHYGWPLKFGQIAMIWRGGCIIRARFLQKIKEAYDREPGLANLLLDPFFAGVVQKAQENWRQVVAVGARSGVPLPAFGSALAYYDSYRCERLPANLLQAQRDFFGAHTYERVDQPRGRFFHIDWPHPDRPQVPVE